MVVMTGVMMASIMMMTVLTMKAADKGVLVVVVISLFG